MTSSSGVYDSESFEQFQSQYGEEEQATEEVQDKIAEKDIGNETDTITKLFAQMMIENRRRDALLETLVNRIVNTTPKLTAVYNASIMPDLLQKIPTFDGSTDKAEGWIYTLESAQLLHSLPDNYVLETARTRLKRRQIDTRKQLNVGDYVVIKNIDTTPNVNKKLLAKFKGPYKIKKVLPNDRYVACNIDDFPVTQPTYEEFKNQRPSDYTQGEEEKEKDGYPLTEITEEQKMKEPTVEECREIIGNLKCGKAPVTDEIPDELVKVNEQSKNVEVNKRIQNSSNVLKRNTESDSNTQLNNTNMRTHSMNDEMANFTHEVYEPAENAWTSVKRKRI
ncbi:hypothetical protein QE152_g23126 [Popillia japonica]|uniref:Polyprotein n=1 Tax=Popillia japonica TaxID=7064 RepID=A0AAW1KID9_POPJA